MLHKYISIKKLFPFDQNYQFSHPLAARAIRDLSDCFVAFLATHRQASKKFFSKLARIKTTVKTINYYKKCSIFIILYTTSISLPTLCRVEHRWAIHNVVRLCSLAQENKQKTRFKNNILYHRVGTGRVRVR